MGIYFKKQNFYKWPPEPSALLLHHAALDLLPPPLVPLKPLLPSAGLQELPRVAPKSSPLLEPSNNPWLRLVPTKLISKLPAQLPPPEPPPSLSPLLLLPPPFT